MNESRRGGVDRRQSHDTVEVPATSERVAESVERASFGVSDALEITVGGDET